MKNKNYVSMLQMAEARGRGTQAKEDGRVVVALVRRQSGWVQKGQCGRSIRVNERRRGQTIKSGRAQQEADDDGVECSYLVSITIVA
jgi:hypothetical protein